MTRKNKFPLQEAMWPIPLAEHHEISPQHPQLAGITFNDMGFTLIAGADRASN